MNAEARFGIIRTQRIKHISCLRHREFTKFPLSGKSRFIVQHLPSEAGYRYYLFTDGTVDQFGYAKFPDGRHAVSKFMSRRWKELLLHISKESPSWQKASIQRALAEWRQDLEQTDDICVIGFGR